MKNKKALWTIIFVVLAAMVFAVVLILAKGVDRTAEETADPFESKEFDSLDEAVKYAEFRLEHSDRLNGVQATGYVCSKRKIVVRFGGEGTISKTLIDEDDAVPSEGTSEAETDPAQTEEHVIDRVTVLFYGSGDAFTAARWTDNGYEYAITLESGGNVTGADMTEYVKATR